MQLILFSLVSCIAAQGYGEAIYGKDAISKAGESEPEASAPAVVESAIALPEVTTFVDPPVDAPVEKPPCTEAATETALPEAELPIETPTEALPEDDEDLEDCEEDEEEIPEGYGAPGAESTFGPILSSADSRSLGALAAFAALVLAL